MIRETTLQWLIPALLAIAAAGASGIVSYFTAISQADKQIAVLDTRIDVLETRAREDRRNNERSTKEFRDEVVVELRQLNQKMEILNAQMNQIVGETRRVR
jgi:hypothetical protein